jgi:hypothetical protein
VYVVGPFPEGVVSLLPRPGAAVASQSDHRRVSTFISSLRSYPAPVAALPGPGFWPVERVPGVSFNWLGDAGVVDVYSRSHRSGSVWLTFVGRSLVDTRTLSASSGGVTIHTSVGTTAHPIRIGPFPLVDGRARVLLRASPGARRYPGDPRALSVQFALLAAQRSGSER